MDTGGEGFTELGAEQGAEPGGGSGQAHRTLRLGGSCHSAEKANFTVPFVPCLGSQSLLSQRHLTQCPLPDPYIHHTTHSLSPELGDFPHSTLHTLLCCSLVCFGVAWFPEADLAL